MTIFESSKLVLIPHPLCDPTEFGSLADLHGISSKEGYLGGLRLLQVIERRAELPGPNDKKRQKKKNSRAQLHF